MQKQYQNLPLICHEAPSTRTRVLVVALEYVVYMQYLITVHILGIYFLLLPSNADIGQRLHNP